MAESRWRGIEGRSFSRLSGRGLSNPVLDTRTAPDAARELLPGGFASLRINAAGLIPSADNRNGATMSHHRPLFDAALKPATASAGIGQPCSLRVLLRVWRNSSKCAATILGSFKIDGASSLRARQ